LTDLSVDLPPRDSSVWETSLFTFSDASLWTIITKVQTDGSQVVSTIALFPATQIGASSLIDLNNFEFHYLLFCSAKFSFSLSSAKKTVFLKMLPHFSSSLPEQVMLHSLLSETMPYLPKEWPQ
jgi:hypothetical protein